MYSLILVFLDLVNKFLLKLSPMYYKLKLINFT